MNTFEHAMSFVALHEWSNREDGGYTNDPVDPGGETKFGISKAAHPDVDIKNLTLKEALEIYRRDYWSHYGLGHYPDVYGTALFDAYIQHRPSVVSRMHQAANGDWRKLNRERSAFYLRLIEKNPAMRKYRRGWANRVNDLNKFCELMEIQKSS